MSSGELGIEISMITRSTRYVLNGLRKKGMLEVFPLFFLCGLGKVHFFFFNPLFPIETVLDMVRG